MKPHPFPQLWQCCCRSPTGSSKRNRKGKDCREAEQGCRTPGGAGLSELRMGEWDRLGRLCLGGARGRRWEYGDVFGEMLGILAREKCSALVREKRWQKEIFFQYQQEARPWGNINQFFFFLFILPQGLASVMVAADHDNLIQIPTSLCNLSCLCPTSAPAMACCYNELCSFFGFLWWSSNLVGFFGFFSIIESGPAVGTFVGLTKKIPHAFAFDMYKWM